MSDAKKNVRVVMYVDGEEYATIENQIEEWALEHVAFAVVAQVDDPDYEGAREMADAAKSAGY